MKKIVPLLALVTLAFVGTSLAQTANSTPVDGDVHSADPLAAHRPVAKSSAAPANTEGKKMVGEAMLTSDEKGKSSTTTFPAGTATVYLVTKNVSGAKGDKVRADWYVDDAGKAMTKGKRFNSSEVTLPDTGSYPPTFHASNTVNGAFAPGKYHVDLFVGGQKMKTLPFTVK